jgi:hypothetical protein
MNPEDLTELTRLSQVLDRHCEDIGRDPATVRRAVQFRLPATADETLRAAERYQQAGFSDIIFMPYVGGVAAVEATAALLPRLRTIG